MSTQTHWLCPVCVALLLTGCGVPHTRTIHVSGEVAYEPLLIGAWETTIEDSQKLTFDVSKWSHDDNSYRFVVNAEHGKKPLCEGRAYLSRIEDRQYLTVGSADSEQQVPRYNTIVVDELQPKLQVRILNRQWLLRTIKADPTVITHQWFPNGDFLITATTEELKAFYQKHLKEDAPWEKFILSRKK